MVAVEELTRRFYHLVDRSNAFISYDLAKCVGCGRCVSTANDVGCKALELVSVGDGSVMMPTPSRRWADSACLSCGSCIDVCTAGALEHQHRFGTGKKVGEVGGRCLHCGHGCEVIFDIDDDGTPLIGRPVGAGPICSQGRYGHDFVNDRRRLTGWHINRGRHGLPCSSSDGLAVAARELDRVVSHWGGDAVALVMQPELPLAEIDAAVRFLTDRLGGRRVFFLPTVAPAFEESLWSPIDALTMSEEQAASTTVINLAGASLEGCLVTWNRVNRLRADGARLLTTDETRKPYRRRNLIQRDMTPIELLKSVVAAPSRRLGRNRQAVVIVGYEYLCFNYEEVVVLIKQLREKVPTLAVAVGSPRNGMRVAEHVRRLRPAVEVGGAMSLERAVRTGAVRGAMFIDVNPLRELMGGRAMVHALMDLSFVLVHNAFEVQSTWLGDVIAPRVPLPEMQADGYDSAGRRLTWPKVLEPLDGAWTVAELMDTLSSRVTVSPKTVATESATIRVSDATPKPDPFGRLKLVFRESPWHRAHGALTTRTRLGCVQNFDPLIVSVEDGLVFDIRTGDLTIVEAMGVEIVVRAIVNRSLRPGWAVMSNTFAETAAQMLWGAGWSPIEPTWIAVRRYMIRDQKFLLSDDQRMAMYSRRYGIHWRLKGGDDPSLQGEGEPNEKR